MYLDNVGMAQFGNDACLPLEAEKRVRIVLTQIPEDLDCYFAIERSMRANINLCYTTPSNQRFNLNLTQSFPNPIGHNQIILNAQNLTSSDALLYLAILSGVCKVVSVYRSLCVSALNTWCVLLFLNLKLSPPAGSVRHNIHRFKWNVCACPRVFSWWAVDLVFQLALAFLWAWVGYS